MVVQELIAKLGFDVDQAGLNRADQGIASLAKGAAVAVAGIYAAKQAMDALIWGVTSSIAAASAKEDVTTQFKVMLGDLEAAKYLYQEINKYANITSYSTAGAAQSVQMMMSSLSAKDALSNMKMIGDIALGDNERMQGIARAVSQVAAKRKLQGDELMQLRERMFDPLVYLAEMRGVSQAELEAQVQKGKLGIQDLTAAMEYATSKGQKFYKGAEEGGKTWSGIVSTTKDNFVMLGAELGDKMLPMLKAILSEFMKLWPAISSAVVTLADFFGIMFRDGPTATEWASGFAGAMETIADAIMVAATGFQFLWAVVGAFGEYLNLAIVGVLETILQIPKYLAYAAKGVSELIILAGKASGSRSMVELGVKERQRAEDFIGTGLYKYTSEFMGVGDRGAARFDKFWEMADKLGTRSPSAGQVKNSDRIESLMTKQAGKQPLTNITQNNNLTINAEDPLKTMAEAPSARFMQGAFLAIRHATN
jgi:tape measure domain-containing protein